MKRCTTCHRTDNDLGACGSNRTCPAIQGAELPEVDPRRDCVLHCGPCGLTRAVPVAILLSGKLGNMDVTCQRGIESCACVIVPQGAAQPAPDGKHGRTQGPVN